MAIRLKNRTPATGCACKAAYGLAQARRHAGEIKVKSYEPQTGDVNERSRLRPCLARVPPHEPHAAATTARLASLPRAGAQVEALRARQVPET